MPRHLRAYLKAVLRHGWWLAIAAVGVVGDVGTILGNAAVPRSVWYALIAVGILAAQYRAYSDVMDQLAQARARIRDLDTVEAKRAYLDDALTDLAALRADLDAETYPDEDAWYAGRNRILQDVAHWEDIIRADLRKSFPAGSGKQFDSDEGLQPLPDKTGHGDQSQRNLLLYLDNRRTRLEQLKQNLK